MKRPMPGTNEHDIYTRLLVAMSRAGLQVNVAGCALLAKGIQKHGRGNPLVIAAAEGLGLSPEWLPNKRTS